MSFGGDGPDRAGRRLIADATASRHRAQAVAGLRGLARPRPGRAGAGGTPGGTGVLTDPSSGAEAQAGDERCDICGLSIPSDHRHLLHLVERRIVCSCEACWAMRAGEGDYRPTGNRTVWLPDLNVPDELWASFQIPIGLAFFMRSTVTECVVAMYPSPAGATESELHFESWARMCELNPVLAELEPDIEGLIVNRLVEPAVYAIAPIDRCYELTGAIKATWDGISGGSGVTDAVTRFFDELHARGQAVIG
ncbi:MAG: DUF5947 family protein [Solirubrobacteraceae bacterium]